MTENSKMPNFNSDYEKKLYIKYKNAGYSEDSIAKMIEICVKDKELFDSGKINTEEGKLLHKYYNVQKAEIINAEMSPEEEIFHGLKELRKIKRKLDNTTDEKEREALEKEDRELAMYMGVRIMDVDNAEFEEAVVEALGKLNDNDANSSEVTEAIRNVRSKIRGKGELKENSATKDVDLTKEQKEKSLNEGKLAKSMVRVSDKLSKKVNDVCDEKDKENVSIKNVGRVVSSQFDVRNMVR